MYTHRSTLRYHLALTPFLLLALTSNNVSQGATADITNQHLPQIAQWLRSLSTETPTPTSMLGQKVTLQGTYIFNENTGSFDYSNPDQMRYTGRPERGANWSGAAIRGDFRDAFVSWVDVYCADSATYQEELLTMQERIGGTYNLPSTQVGVTVTGTVMKGVGTIGGYQMILAPGCSVTFDVPAWTATHVANAIRLQVPLDLAEAARATEAAEPWNAKANFVFFRQAMLADGVVDDAELAFFQTLLSDPGMYILEAEGQDPVQFRNYWVPRRYNADTRRYQDAMGLFYTQITQREVPTSLDQALQVGWKQKPADVVLVHRGYTGNEIERSLTYGMVVADLVALMQESNASNTYGPIRGEISQWFATLNEIEDEEERMAIRESLWYLTDQAARAARYRDHNVPEFLYNWIKP